jgi:hypothetical protein
MFTIETNVLNSNIPPCCHKSLPYTMVSGIKIIHQRIQIICLHASHCHHCHYCYHCNVDFGLFYNVMCYINSLLSCIHVNTTYLLNIMCTFGCHDMILGRLECSRTFTCHSSKNLERIIIYKIGFRPCDMSP